MSALALVLAAPPAHAQAAAPVAITQLVVEPDYQLGVADKIRVIVFNEPSLSGEFLVNANGSLSLPLIGDVTAQSRTPGEVAADIESRLRQGYVLAPRVSIDVLTYRPFYILGEVNKPGEYAYSSGLTLDAAVAMAEGYTYRANKKRVSILHKGDSSAQIMKISAVLSVRPGDTIRIDERHW